MPAERAHLSGGLRCAPPPPAPTDRAIAVLIVAYRVPADVAACLRAVREHLPAAPVLIWDNSGPDYPGMAEVRAAFPEADWHGEGTNIGFAAGVNRTIWPGFTVRYWWETRHLDPTDFEFFGRAADAAEAAEAADDVPSTAVAPVPLG